MNRTLRILAAATAVTFVSIPAAYAQSTPRTGEQLATEAAAKGSTELRRFIQRTRMVYGLAFNDFRKAE